VVEEQLKHTDVAVGDGEVQRRLQQLGRGLNVRPACEQQVERVGMVPNDG
jgi:hypothetical protein